MRRLTEDEFEQIVEVIFEDRIPSEDLPELLIYYNQIAVGFEKAKKRIPEGKEPALLFKV